MAVALQNARPARTTRTAPRKESARRPNLVVLEKQKRQISKTAVIVGFVLVAMFGVVSLRIVMAQQQVKLDQLNRDVTKARQYFDELRAERSNLQSPSVLMQQATAIGMEPAVKVKIIAVSPEVAATVAATVGKIDSSFLEPSSSPLVQFGELKSRVGSTP